VSAVETLSETVVAIGDYAVGHDASAKNKIQLDVTGRLAFTVQRIRMHVSAAIDLVWLAEGWTRCPGVVRGHDRVALYDERTPEVFGWLG
jgi:myo-inositol-1(or 4)-monophosphatase